MHSHSIESYRHEHVFLGRDHDANETRTWLVVALTLAMMVAEIVGGTFFGSMAVVADGWHMSTHAAALAIAALAYRFARRHARDERFTFGTGKVGELAGFASALILGMIAIIIAYESALRLMSPVAIQFGEAIGLAVVGLGVNLASAWLLAGHHGHHHDHHHGHDHHGEHDHHGHDHHGQDSNMRAALVHVLADALTSVLAIAALLGGLFYGLNWLDPVIGIVGAAVILSWAVSLVRTTAGVLLDRVPDTRMPDLVRSRLEVGGDRVSDLHLWRLGPGHHGVVAAIVSDEPQEPEVYKRRLAGIEALSHVTVEVVRCPHAAEAA